MKKGTKIKVIWLDAQAFVGWERASKKFKSARCTSIGFLVRKTKKEIVIAGTKGGSEVNCVMAIPLDWVQKVEKL